MSQPGPSSQDADMHPLAKALFGWVSLKSTGAIVFWGLLGLSVVLIVGDLLVDRHYKEEVEGLTGFYALYGFLSFSFVVLMGWPLGRLLRRGENYYGDHDDGEVDK